MRRSVRGVHDAPRHACTARRSSSSRPTATSRPSRAGASATRCAHALPGLPRIGAALDRDRAAGCTDRPKTGVFLERVRDQPRQRRARCRSGPPTTCSPTTATARSWPCPPHDQRDLDFARAFDLPVRVVDRHQRARHGRHPRDRAGRRGRSDDPAGRHAVELDPPSHGRSPSHGDGRLINSASLDGLSKSATRSRASSSMLDTLGTGRAAKTFRLRDWLISRPAVLGHADPDDPHRGRPHACRCRTSELPLRLPGRRRARPQAQGLRRRSARPTEWMKRPRLPDDRRGRRGATPTRWTRSSTARGTSCASSTPNDPDEGVRPRGGARVGARRLSTIGGVEHAILHLLYARFITKVLFDMGTDRLHRAVLAPAQPGHGARWAARRCRESKGNLVEFACEHGRSCGADALRVDDRVRRTRSRTTSTGRTSRPTGRARSSWPARGASPRRSHRTRCRCGPRTAIAAPAADPPPVLADAPGAASRRSSSTSSWRVSWNSSTRTRKTIDSGLPRRNLKGHALRRRRAALRRQTRRSRDDPPTCSAAARGGGHVAACSATKRPASRVAGAVAQGRSDAARRRPA